MIKKILKVNLIFKSRALKFVLRALGLCSACFLIEACYGSPQSEAPQKNITLKGNVQSNDSLKPIQGIKIKATELENHNIFFGVTDSSGNYAFSASYSGNGNFMMQYIDEDGLSNGVFQNKDSNITITDQNATESVVNLKLKRIP
jgi:putative lipoprotein (rSAM/lipoprotein system)